MAQRGERLHGWRPVSGFLSETSYSRPPPGAASLQHAARSPGVVLSLEWSAGSVAGMQPILLAAEPSGTLVAPGVPPARPGPARVTRSPASPSLRSRAWALLAFASDEAQRKSEI